MIGPALRTAAVVVLGSALLGGCGSAVPGSPEPAPGARVARPVFDEAALEGDRGVKVVLINSYGVPADEIEGVDCPADEEVRQGNKFTCTVRLGGDDPKEQVVEITVRNDDGEYEVGAPHDR